MRFICPSFTCFFFVNDTATTEIYTLSLHDALPISILWMAAWGWPTARRPPPRSPPPRSEEHTSELQSPCNLVCRLLLEKKHVCYLDEQVGRSVCARRVATDEQQCNPARVERVHHFFFFNDVPPAELPPFPLHGFFHA